MDLHPMVFELCGTVGRGTEPYFGCIAECSSSRPETNPQDEELFHTLCSLVLQHTAVSVNRRSLDFGSRT